MAEFAYKLFKESIVDGKRTNTITYDQILFIGYLMAQADMLANERQAFIHTIVDEYQDTNPLQDAFIRYLQVSASPLLVMWISPFMGSVAGALHLSLTMRKRHRFTTLP